MIYKTDNGKELAIKYEGRNCIIGFVGGGELPEELKGIFTSYKLAETKVLNYLEKRKPELSDKTKSRLSEEMQQELLNRKSK